MNYFCPLRSLLIILYLVCFGCYILYTRKPDFFDGETSPATIHFLKDSASQRMIPEAVFLYRQKNYAIDARYVFREFSEGQRVEVIYETEDPSKAAVYMLWGYWFRWQEIVGSVIAIVVLFQVAVLITSNPTPEAIMDQLEIPKEKKRKYLE